MQWFNGRKIIIVTNAEADSLDKLRSGKYHLRSHPGSGLARPRKKAGIKPVEPLVKDDADVSGGENND